MCREPGRRKDPTASLSLPFSFALFHLTPCFSISLHPLFLSFLSVWISIVFAHVSTSLSPQSLPLENTCKEKVTEEGLQSRFFNMIPENVREGKITLTRILSQPPLRRIEGLPLNKICAFIFFICAGITPGPGTLKREKTAPTSSYFFLQS